MIQDFSKRQTDKYDLDKEKNELINFYDIENNSYTEIIDCFNPNLIADELFKTYQKFIEKIVRNYKTVDLLKYSFSKYTSRVVFNKKTKLKQRSQIAIRLLFTPNRCSGIRILSFSAHHDFYYRKQLGFDAITNEKLVKSNKTIVKAFTELSKKLGFEILFFTKENGLVLVAKGSYKAFDEVCYVIIEIALGKHDKALFRLQNHH